MEMFKDVTTYMGVKSKSEALLLELQLLTCEALVMLKSAILQTETCLRDQVVEREKDVYTYLTLFSDITKVKHKVC